MPTVLLNWLFDNWSFWFGGYGKICLFITDFCALLRAYSFVRGFARTGWGRGDRN